MSVKIETDIGPTISLDISMTNPFPLLSLNVKHSPSYKNTESRPAMRQTGTIFHELTPTLKRKMQGSKKKVSLRMNL